MREYNCFCTNVECSEKFNTKWIECTEEESENITCSVCGEVMKCVGHKMHGGIMDFSSKTSEQKKEIIHKRAVDHFNKTDKGDLANYKKKIINDIRKKALGGKL